MSTAMSIPELLSWAHDETKMADTLEDGTDQFSRIFSTDVPTMVARHRKRSRWLDELVALRLDEREREEGK